MSTLTLKIKPLEPLMLRQAGEFDPSTRGVYSYASSLAIPRPSTITGMIITHLAHLSQQAASICGNIDSWRKLLELYEQALDALGIYAIRGPYIYDTCRGDIYVPLRLSGEAKLVNYNRIYRYLLRVHGDLLAPIFEGKSDPSHILLLKQVEEKLSKDHSLEVKEIWRTGVKLRRSEAMKTAEEGYLYTAKYIAYPESVEVRFKLIVSEESPLLGRNVESPVKLGGEHRVAKIAISPEHDVVDKLLSYEDPPKNFYVLLLSPMPLRKIGKVEYVGCLDVIGLGFSIARTRRKPIYKAILEGSILRIIKQDKHSKHSLNEVFRLGLHRVLGVEDEELGILARIGYSSFIPLIPK